VFFIRFCLFWGVLLSFVPVLQGIEPHAAMFEAFALQFAVGNLALALAVLLLRRRLRSWRPWAIAGLLGSFWSVATVWPDVTFRAAASPGSPSLKVANVNIWYHNRDVGQVVAYLAALDADIVGLVEVTRESKPALAPLRALYPYGIDCVDRGQPCQAVLLSKFPLDNAFAGRIGGYGTAAAQGDVAWQGRRIRVTVIHIPTPALGPFFRASEPPVPPMPGAPDLWQSQQAAFLAHNIARSREEGADQIVLGDFNSVPWGSLQRAFRGASGLENRGAFPATWAPSWPSWHPSFARIPIDPVFAGGGLAIRSLKVGPDVGSDHLPVEAEIVIKSE
jgi:endonuclease/exonuclease/phosphatase (EEP) superfamily protein YafD